MESSSSDANSVFECFDGGILRHARRKFLKCNFTHKGVLDNESNIDIFDVSSNYCDKIDEHLYA